jgi:hypothetical protein
LTDIFAPVVDKKRLSKREHIPEIGASLTRENMMMVAMNMGTEGNTQRLLDGEGWTHDQAMAIVNRLTKEEMDVVQAVLDYIGTYKDKIGKQQLELTGLEPEWVKSTAIETVHGTYRGGYLPAKYDTDRSTKSLNDEAANNVNLLWRAKRGTAKTKDSFTKARADKVIDRPLRKDFGVVFQHVTEVTHRLAWEGWIRDARKLVADRRIDGAIRKHYGPEMIRELNKSIEDIAIGDLPAQNIFEKGVSWIRNGATIVGLGWRFSTAMLQPLGLTQSMVRIGPKYVAKGMATWMGSAVRMESKVKEIMDKSAMLRLRHKTMQREISEIRNQVTGDMTPTEIAIRNSYFTMIHRMQLVADIPTWLGAYEKAWVTDPSMDEATAIALADQAVIDAQGAGTIKDLAQIQRGGPLQKLFTNFYSYFNATYNLSRESVGRTDFRSPAQVAALAADFLLLYTVPALLGFAIREAMGMGGDDDDEDLAATLAKEQAMYMLGTMVGLRELGSVISGYSYGGPAGLRFYNEISKAAKQIKEGEWDEAAFDSILNTGGILFHYPAGQIEKTLDGVNALIEGKTKNPGVLMTGYNE